MSATVPTDPLELKSNGDDPLYPDDPPADPKDPLPVDEPGTTIPIKDPTPTPEEDPGGQPVIDPPAPG